MLNPVTGLPDPYQARFLGLPEATSRESISFDDSNGNGERQIRLLAVDGGGIRGIISARILAEIEARTHRATAELFDVMAGTSTGAILSMGLNAKADDGSPLYTASDIVELYSSRGSTIFPEADSWGIFAPKYRADGLEATLRELFGERKLRDTRVDSFVPAFETTDYHPYIFTKSQLPLHPEWDSLRIRDVLRCTTAAPVYFPSVELRLGDKKYNFVDGGVYANNPSLYGAVYAQKVYQPCEIDILCSLGTGTVDRSISHYQSSEWGVYGWGFNIIQLMTASQSDATHHTMWHLLPEEKQKQRYYRFQPKLAEGTGALDAADDYSIRYLLNTADQLIEERVDEINKMCEKLSASLE